MSYDRRVEGAGVVETAHKIRNLSPLWWGMYAGECSEAHEVLGRYSLYLREHEDEIDSCNVIDHIWQPIYAQNHAYIRRLRDSPNVECEFLLVGYFDKRFHLLRFVKDWTIYDAFAAIGRGWYVAEAVLSGRDKSSIRMVPEMLYRVYEAQRIGTCVPSVGSHASLHLLTYENGMVQRREVMDDRFLEELWTKFGIKDIVVNWGEDNFPWYP
jgi:hypothetical protein